MRRRIAAILDGLAAMLLGAALVRVVAGPQTFLIGDAALSVRTLSRPLLIAALILVARVWLLPARTERFPGIASVVSRVTLAAVICAGAIAWIAFLSVACGGADSYGYVSAAERLLAGTLVQPEPLAHVLPFADAITAATPLGHTPSPRVAGASVPVYPLGLPLLMAAAIAMVGDIGPFFVAPAMGIVLLVALYASAYALTRERLVALTATALTAVHPLVFTYSIQPMSDVPAAALFLIAVAVLVRERPRPVLAGIAAAMCLLIRPALAPALLSLIAIPSLRARRFDFAATVLFGSPLACGVAAQLAIQSYLYGHPLANGYADMGTLFAIERVGPNARSHAYWAWRSLGPAFLGAAVIGLVVTSRLTRIAVLLVVVTVTFPYLPYRTFDHWETLRFLLPALVMLTIPAAAGLLAVGRRVAGEAGGSLLVALLVIAVAHGWTAWLRSNQVFAMPEHEARHRLAGELVTQVTPPNAVILAEQHSGSIRYYARRASANWNRVPAGAMPATVAALHRAGYPVYLLIDSDEERAIFEQKHGPVADWLPGGQRRNVQLFEARGAQ